MTLVHVIRHGEVYNPDKVLYGRLPGFRLSEFGEAQAEKTAAALEGRNITYVVSSPLERAIQTATPLAEALGLPIERDERLIEAANRFQGQRVAGGTSRIAAPSNWRLLYNPLRPSWGEPYGEIAARVRAAVIDAAAAARGAGDAAARGAGDAAARGAGDAAVRGAADPAARGAGDHPAHGTAGTAARNVEADSPRGPAADGARGDADEAARDTASAAGDAERSAGGRVAGGGQGAKADGPEAVCVTHQLPVVALRRLVLGQRLWHDPRQRQCALASVTTFAVEGDDVRFYGYAEPAGATPTGYVGGA
jgi:broad specificity phosphatase PhoE